MMMIMVTMKMKMITSTKAFWKHRVWFRTGLIRPVRNLASDFVLRTKNMTTTATATTTTKKQDSRDDEDEDAEVNAFCSAIRVVRLGNSSA